MGVGNTVSKALYLAGVRNQVTVSSGCFFNLEAVARPGDLPDFKAVIELAVEQGQHDVVVNHVRV